MPKATIFVVEDDNQLRAGIRDILLLEDYDVLTAEDGQVALKRLMEQGIVPDLILSDIMMPHLDGVQLLRHIRQQPQYVSVPFIFLTARGERADIQRAKLLGVDDYLIKPFQPDDLIIAVESRLRRSRAIDQTHRNREEKLKTNILSMLQHEFRTPLMYIVGYSELLEEFRRVASSDSADMLEFLQGIQSGADRLHRLVENFILLVELETGGAKEAYQRQRRSIDNIGKLIQDAAKQSHQLHDASYTYKIRVAKNLPPFIAHPEYLKMAIYHLIDNAFKFSERGQSVEISAYPDHENVCIRVEDKGRGIEPNHHREIWNMFYQVNRQRYEDQGAGSGLAIVSGVARIHGGRVDLRSEVGVGSTFIIRIPYIAVTDANVIE